MFSRYIHILEKYTKNIIIQSPTSMIRLMQYNFPQLEIVNNDNIIDEVRYDLSTSFFCLLLSLNGISLREIPFKEPYLNVEEKISNYFNNSHNSSTVYTDYAFSKLIVSECVSEDKVLYLDTDIIIKGDISSIWCFKVLFSCSI